MGSSASLNDVAAAVGITKPAIYHHFASKEELLKAVATGEADDNAEQMKAIAADPTMGSRDKLTRVIDLIYHCMLETSLGDLMPVIAETSVRFPDVAAYFYNDFVIEMDAAVIEIVKEGVRRGEFRDTVLSEQISLLVGPPMMLALHRSMFRHVEQEVEGQIARAKAAHLDMLLQVLEPR